MLKDYMNGEYSQKKLPKINLQLKNFLETYEHIRDDLI